MGKMTANSILMIDMKSYLNIKGQPHDIDCKLPAQRLLDMDCSIDSNKDSPKFLKIINVFLKLNQKGSEK